jgi:ADP-ribosylglycohydrolase
MNELDRTDPGDQWLPTWIQPCPICGDTTAVQAVVHGFPAGSPPEDLADRLYFAGCVLDEWALCWWYCPADERFYGNDAASSLFDAETESRALGCVIGSAVGDALGAPYEFGEPHAFSGRFPGPVLGGSGEMVAGGPWRAGEATDDTQMAVIEAESLLDAGGIDEARIFGRFVRWADHRFTKDVGISTRQVLGHPAGWPEAARLVAEQTGKGAGNGTIMRAAPAAVWLACNPAAAGLDPDEASMRLAGLTHGDPMAGWGRVVLNRILAAGIGGGDPLGAIPDALAALPDEARERYEPLLAPDWEPEPGQRNGVVWTCLAQAVWAVRNAGSFAEAMRRAIDLGGDTDTVAAVAGAIGGARWGLAAIPSRWTAYLHLSVPIDDEDRRYDHEALHRLTRRLMGEQTAPVQDPPALGPTEIEDGVHAASLSGAATVPKDWGVVSLSRSGGRFAHHPYRRAVYLVDLPGANPGLAEAVTDAVGAIDTFVGEGRHVVVHCHGGDSRTGLVLRAWLMRRHDWGSEEATAFLAERWPHLDTWQEEFTEFLGWEWNRAPEAKEPALRWSEEEVEAMAFGEGWEREAAADDSDYLDWLKDQG